ncbi:MAG: flagellin [Pseudomonadales bacterium]|nr:flagellin [Pseudomonadales bacterium]
MPQIINTNIGSLTAQRNLNTTQAQSLQALNRLSSGLRINSARDDAAGLAIATRFTAQVRGLGVAIRNANDGISMAQTAEGALGSMTESLQRLRELALQSANATNSLSDRQALDAEAKQLISELRRVSEQTNFNGKNLLDGSLKTSVQIGTQVGETVELSINEVTVDKLGGGIGAGVSAVGDSSAISNGDLLINGVAISPSAAADDQASTNNAAASAIAKVAAINRHTEETGVSAQVSANVAAGSAMSAVATAGTITINGVSIAVNTTAATDTSRAAVITAINAKSEQTGVTAVDTGNDAGGVQLVAEDGRNIQVTLTGVAAAHTGLAAAGTYEGGYTLISEDGSDIVLTGGDNSGNGNIANAGLSSGSYSGTAASAISNGQAGTTVNALVAGDLIINGVSVGASLATDDTASSASNSASGIAIAAAINKVSDKSGVTASAKATELVGGTAQSAAAQSAASIVVNGVSTAAFATGTDAEVNRTTAISAINAISGRTGVVAKDNGTTITLNAADGRNISVEVASAGFGVAVGLDATVNGIYINAAAAEYATSEVVLNSASAFTIEGGTTNGSAGVTNVGFEVGTFGGATDGQFLTEIDLTSVEGSEKALKAIDNALDSVNRERANLGAIQNRLDSTVSSLAINLENTSAARSRILDADFAAETAQLSRTQVLQQAGVSILAQANAQPQLVLSLLQ